jgi:hypothetical protein
MICFERLIVFFVGTEFSAIFDDCDRFFLTWDPFYPITPFALEIKSDPNLMTHLRVLLMYDR